MKATLNKMYDLIPTFGMEQLAKWQKVIFAVVLLLLWIKLLGIRGFAFLIIGLTMLWAVSTIIMYFEDKVQK